MYQVIRSFLDKTDNNHLYKVGDVYPKEGGKTTKARAKELLTGDNATGQIYLREIPEPKQDTASESDKD